VGALLQAAIPPSDTLQDKGSRVSRIGEAGAASTERLDRRTAPERAIWARGRLFASGPLGCLGTLTLGEMGENYERANL
jgi:hypothetical protein